jgi:hypothetical protein
MVKDKSTDKFSLISFILVIVAILLPLSMFFRTSPPTLLSLIKSNCFYDILFIAFSALTIVFGFIGLSRSIKMKSQGKTIALISIILALIILIYWVKDIYSLSLVLLKLEKPIPIFNETLVVNGDSYYYKKFEMLRDGNINLNISSDENINIFLINEPQLELYLKSGATNSIQSFIDTKTFKLKEYPLDQGVYNILFESNSNESRIDLFLEEKIPLSHIN